MAEVTGGELIVKCPATRRNAVGDLVLGEGAMGLARTFLLAGARTVVASLWPLQDAYERSIEFSAMG